jgi:hypothetical protein
MKYFTTEEIIMNKFLKTASFLSIFIPSLCAMDNIIENNDNDNENSIQMPNEIDIKDKIKNIGLPETIFELDLDKLKETEHYRKAQEFIKNITFSNPENKKILRDFLRKNILKMPNEYENFFNDIATQIKEGTHFNLTRPSSLETNKLFTYIKMPFFKFAWGIPKVI